MQASGDEAAKEVGTTKGMEITKGRSMRLPFTSGRIDSSTNLNDRLDCLLLVFLCVDFRDSRGPVAEDDAGSL